MKCSLCKNGELFESDISVSQTDKIQDGDMTPDQIRGLPCVELGPFWMKCDNCGERFYNVTFDVAAARALVGDEGVERFNRALRRFDKGS